MAEKQQNILQKNIILLSVVGGVAILSGIYLLSGKDEQVSTGAASVAVAPIIDAVPASSDSAEYNKSVEVFNENKANAALETGGTHIPTLTSENAVKTINPLDLVMTIEEPVNEIEEFEKIQEKEREINMPVLDIPVDTTIVTPQVQIEAVQMQPVQPALPVVPATPPKYGQQDFLVLEALLDIQKSKRPSAEFNYKGDTSGLEAAAEAEKEAVAQYQANATQAATTQQTAQQKHIVLKAGDIVQAVLETEINSKEPSPIVAKIITGKLAGARLIGSVQTVGKKVVLQFSTINIPSQPTSLKISAVAVDLNTSRTALASEVNNHYFLKYGLLLGSAFLKGWSQAISSQNQTTQISDNGVITVQNGDKTSKDINREALGEVGNELSSEIRSNRGALEPTIKVYKDTAIGLLLMEDFGY